MITPTPFPRKLFATASALAGIAAAVPAVAQSTPPAGDVTTMAKFEVKDVPLEKQILPTARPSSPCLAPKTTSSMCRAT